MKHRIIAAVLAAATLALGASLALAAEVKAAAASDGKAGVSAKAATQSKSASAVKRSVPALAKPVDINKASIKQLKKLPGVTDEIAAKIVAGRPYASKADLVTHNIVDSGVYGGIRQSVVAKQPYKDGAKNAALYKK